MTDDDDALWHRMTKDIKKLHPERKTQKLQKSKPVKKEAQVKQGPAPRLEEILPVQSGTEIDRRTDDRLRRGKLKIDGRLDLHGLNREAAQDAVKNFIINAHYSNKRCLLIITGKGTISKPAVLKTNLPDWLDMPDISPLILKTYPAQIVHGGSGAFYVYLRRKRP